MSLNQQVDSGCSERTDILGWPLSAVNNAFGGSKKTGGKGDGGAASMCRVPPSDRSVGFLAPPVSSFHRARQAILLRSFAMGWATTHRSRAA